MLRLAAEGRVWALARPVALASRALSTSRAAHNEATHEVPLDTCPSILTPVHTPLVNKKRVLVPPAPPNMSGRLFLQLIGPEAVQQAKHFECWEDIFSASLHDMKEKGIPVPARRKIRKACGHYRLYGELPLPPKPRKMKQTWDPLEVLKRKQLRIFGQIVRR